MNLALYIARRISFRSQRSFSRVILRIALTAVSLSLATMMITLSMVLGFQAEIKKKIADFSSHILISKPTDYEGDSAGPLKRNAGVEAKIKAIPGVAHIQAYSQLPTLLKTDSTSEGAILKGIGEDFDWKRFNRFILRGHPLSWDTAAPGNEILISKILAEKLELDTGSRLRSYFIDTERGRKHRIRQFKIAGIFQTGIDEFDQQLVLADIRQVNKMHPGWSADNITGYEIFTKSYDQITPVYYAIDNIEAIPIEADIKSIYDRMVQIFDWLNLLNVHIRVIFSLMAIVAVINMVTALIILILERTKMIGLLKALGMKNRTIMKIFIATSLRLVLRGMLTGNIIALALICLQYFGHIIKLDPGQYYLEEAKVSFPWMYFAFINAGTLIICLIAMIIPSYMVVKISPVKALRSF